VEVDDAGAARVLGLLLPVVRADIVTLEPDRLHASFLTLPRLTGAYVILG
jgi:hypothetical protein